MRAGVYFLGFSILSLMLSALTYAEGYSFDGTRITRYTEVLRSVYTDATRIEETKLDPAKAGGSTLMGLVGRLMGGAPNSQFEGVRVQRYFYTAYRGERFLGVTHGSTIEVGGNPIDVIVHYDSDANLRKVEIKNAPSNVASMLTGGKYLDQFEGYRTTDFQTSYEKRRRRLITHSGRAIREVRWPSGQAKDYFDRILRSVKFNVAFVDVAYFIGRLPMLDFSSRRISSIAASAGSPEREVEGTLLSSPGGNRSRAMLLKARQ